MKAHPLLIILFSLSSLPTFPAKEPSPILKSPDFPDPEQPLLPDPPPPPPTPTVPSTRANGTNPIIPIPPQPEKPTKKAAIVISVGVVTLGMLSAFLFYLFKRRTNFPIDTQKLVGTGDSSDQTRIAPPATFLYIGTMEPANNRLQTETTTGSPYRKLNSDHHPRYRPSPEIQPLPPLPKPPANFFPPVDQFSSSEDDNREKTAFYTQNDSSTSNDEGSYTPASNSWTTSHRAFPNSKKNSSSKSRFSISSPEKENTVTLRPPPLPMGKFQSREQIFWDHSISRRLAPRRPPLPRREPERIASRSRSEPESEAETTASSAVATHTGEEEDEGPKL